MAEYAVSMALDSVDVLIHSPFPRQDSQGNTETAVRLEGILRKAGLRVAMEEVWFNGQEAHCMIALNARRSAGAVMEFRDAWPKGKVIVILTGTDINHPSAMDKESDNVQTMEAADYLVVLHEGSLVSVPEHLHQKCKVIHPSVQWPDGFDVLSSQSEHQHEFADPSQLDRLNIIMAGNLRAEKNVGLALAACAMLPEDSPVLLQLYGDAEVIEHSEGYGAGCEEVEGLQQPVGDLSLQMLQATAGPLPFLWRGKLSHADLLTMMAGADLLLNTSSQEGGSNAICEAICLGLPVLASRIDGNVGMLGPGYGGYFDQGDASGLASLLTRCAEEPSYLAQLQQQVQERAALYQLDRESESWLKLLAERLGLTGRPIDV